MQKFKIFPFNLYEGIVKTMFLVTLLTYFKPGYFLIRLVGNFLLLSTMIKGNTILFFLSQQDLIH